MSTSLNGWREADILPSEPGVYLVLVQLEQRFAKWTGEFWCNWSPAADRAAMCHWRGPSAGYVWRELLTTSAEPGAGTR